MAEPDPQNPDAASSDAKAAEPPHPNFWVRQWRGWIKPVGLTILILVTARSSIADWNDVPSGSMEPSILVGDRIVVNKLAYDLRLPFTAREVARWSQAQRGQVITFWNPDSGIRMVKRIIGVPGDTIEMREGELYVNDQKVARTGPLNPGAAAYGKPLEYQETLDGHTYTIQSQAPFDDITFGPIRLATGDVLGIRKSQLILNGEVVEPAAFEAVLDPEYARAKELRNASQNHGRYFAALHNLNRYQKVTNFGPIHLNDLPGSADLDEFWVMGDHRDNSEDSRYYDNRVTAKSITGHAMFIAWSLDESWVPRIDRFFDGLHD